MQNPAEHLKGLTLEGDWYVSEKIEHGDDHSGGNFSICYRVTKNGHTAFLKAIDVSKAMGGPDPTRGLQTLMNAYEYEKELCTTCDGRRMDRVVRILAAGSTYPLKHLPVFVPYLIFELASTTLREHVLETTHNMDNATLMRSLHNVAVAISQLHSAGIVHQDIKGSNVLLFSPDGESKVADLGRAEMISKESIYFHFPIAGDPDYAPPEQRLNYISDKWDVRRRSTDLYLLGSLICFYYTQFPMTALYEIHLAPEFKKGAWKGKFEQVLPVLKDAFQEILEFLEEQLSETFSEKDIIQNIVKLVKFLCDPDPSKRGHPDSLPIDQYAMERFITSFDVLANRFESKLL
ncbi:protein kinase [Chitinophaga pollutisoli]|uniref:Protein kinase n=1 Tax=Chitinophaga pollutisoli TaxID=3133966 RepID=A0ABZ2YT40_9BACT